MRLSEIYIKEIVLGEFWKQVEGDFEINEGESGLTNLLSQADKLVSLVSIRILKITS